MKIAAVLFLLVGLTLARSDTTPDKVNQLETKNVHQVVKAPTLETASTRIGEVQASHTQYHQASRMDNQHIQQQHPQQNQFYNQIQAPHGHSQELSQHYQNQNLPSTYSSQDPSEIHNFHLQGQKLVGSSPHPGQETQSLLQSSQRIPQSGISSFQDQSNEQVRDFAAPEHYANDVHNQQEFQQYRGSIQDVHNQQDFHQYRGGIQDVQGHQVGDGQFDDQSNDQIARGFPSSGMRTATFPKVYHQRSAFDNRQQPIVLPGVTQTHSASSVIVSGGLKNLPALPALIYSSGAVPATHAVAYGRPWFQGGAYIKQHWQTPYARYVYSHIL